MKGHTSWKRLVDDSFTFRHQFRGEPLHKIVSGRARKPGASLGRIWEGGCGTPGGGMALARVTDPGDAERETAGILQLPSQLREYWGLLPESSRATRVGERCVKRMQYKENIGNKPQTGRRCE